MSTSDPMADTPHDVLEVSTVVPMNPQEIHRWGQPRYRGQCSCGVVFNNDRAFYARPDMVTSEWVDHRMEAK